MSVLEEKVQAGGAMPPATTGESSASGQSVRVWDPVVRLFHWSLVAAFVTAWATADEARSVHETAGYFILALIAVRLIWGLVGSSHARFSDFVHRPSVVVAYLIDVVRIRAKRFVGHNPAGGAMVVALMLSLLAVCASGYAMTTDAFWGVGWVEEVHEVSVNLTLALIGLHLIGVLTASIAHRENLAKAMVTGRKRRH